MPKVSEAHKEAVRNRLLDAAAECIRRRGFDNTTTRDILEQAGLSAGALYTYFKSKDDLFIALAERERALMLEMFLHETEGEPPGRSILLRALLATLNPDMGNDLLRQFWYRAAFDAEVAALMNRFEQLIVGGLQPFVDAAKAEHFLREDLDGEALVEVIASLYDGLEARRASGTLVSSVERCVQTAIDLLLYGALPEDQGHRANTRRLVGSLSSRIEFPRTVPAIRSGEDDATQASEAPRETGESGAEAGEADEAARQAGGD